MTVDLRRWAGLAPRTVVAAEPARPRQVSRPVSTVVIGGGIAGVVAATVLAERGVAVTLLEAERYLGGRLGAWPSALPDGTPTVAEHGFHAFFRQYYNLRRFLRRVDPDLAFLREIDDYPVIARAWPPESFGRLPATPPFNLLALLARSKSLRLADLREMDGAAATPLLAFDRDRTYALHDGESAADLLAALRLPERARTMLFDVFAHSFFNAERDMSAAEMIMMMHFYFLGNPEGLRFDVPEVDYAAALWDPLSARLAGYGADLRLGRRAASIEPAAGRWRVHTDSGEPVEADHVVLALDCVSLQRLVAASPALAASAPALSAGAAALAPSPPYVVARLWLDRDVAPDRAVFSGVAGGATLDSITLYHRFQPEHARWAASCGGSVVELHAYAADEGVAGETLVARMRDELAALWPEVAPGRVIHLEWRLGREAPAFGLGSDRLRPGVRTELTGLTLAGDWVRLEFPTALMERSAASALLAANTVLAAAGVAAEPVFCVPRRGLLWRLDRAR